MRVVHWDQLVLYIWSIKFKVNVNCLLINNLTCIIFLAVTRKRNGFADPNKWVKNKRKQNRAAGKTYVDRKGKIRPEKGLS